MILEGIVTTKNPDGSDHVAAMGPHVDPEITQLTLRPFQSSHTLSNLVDHPAGVLHVIDDVSLLVRAALHRWSEPPSLEPAEKVEGSVLVDCCRWFEFVVEQLDRAEERAHVVGRIVYTGDKKPFFGLNRAKHAVVEAAILATRIHLLPLAEIDAELKRLRPLVDKTAGDDEHRAWKIITDYLATARQHAETQASGPQCATP